MSGVLRLIALLVAAISALLSGCGGGGGGGGAPSMPAPPAERTSPLKYGYFGIDGDQIRETADHVSFVMTPDWGDWTIPDYDSFRSMQTITQLQEAKARGVKEAWVSVGWLVFYQRHGCTLGCYVPRPDAIPRLLAFKAQLEALGLLDGFVTTLYPVDEPELHGLTDEMLSPLLAQIKQVWPAYLAVIYGDTRSYPGLNSYDLLGKDKYGAGSGVLNELPPLVHPYQRHIIVPGGSNGLRDNSGPDDPRPFYDYAMAHGNVYAIVPFVWFDRIDERGTPQKGIRSNGMAPAYIGVAQQIKAAK